MTGFHGIPRKLSSLPVYLLCGNPKQDEVSDMFTIIYQRESCAVWYGGHCEGSTESVFSMEVTKEPDTALQLLAEVFYQRLVEESRDLNSNYRYTGAAEIFFGINGYFGRENVVDVFSEEDQQVYDRVDDQRKEMIAKANILAERRFEQRLVKLQEEKKLKEEQTKIEMSRLQEERERKQLAELQAKYGASND